MSPLELPPSELVPSPSSAISFSMSFSDDMSVEGLCRKTKRHSCLILAPTLLEACTHEWSMSFAGGEGAARDSVSSRFRVPASFGRFRLYDSSPQRLQGPNAARTRARPASDSQSADCQHETTSLSTRELNEVNMISQRGTTKVRTAPVLACRGTHS